jgi:type I restriction enzyme R subunit
MEAERHTRETRIDPRLKAAGWTVVEADSPGVATGEHLAIKEFETANGPADYALVDLGRCLGVTEAKKLTVGPQEVLMQAQRYSRGIEQTPRYQGEYGAPFLYSTNGEIIRFQDARHPLNRSRQVRAPSGALSSTPRPTNRLPVIRLPRAQYPSDTTRSGLSAGGVHH